jgi:hypothetical protein
MSKVIPFAVKYGDYFDQPITKLIITIGKEINREFDIFVLYRRELKSGGISIDVKLNFFI